MPLAIVFPPSDLVLIGDQRFEYRAVRHERDMPVHFLPAYRVRRRGQR